jgi:hypothetical protein
VLAADIIGAPGAELVVANYLDGTVQVFTRTASTWTIALTLSVGPRPHGLALADLNLDGLVDLIATNRDGRQVSVLLQTARGVFGPRSSFPVGGGPLWVAVGRLDADRWPDLAVANFDEGSISVLRGNDGGLSPFATLSSPAAHHVAIADVSRDGRADLVVVNHTIGRVGIVEGLVDGGFSPGPLLLSGANPRAVLVADLTGDGLLDLACANYGGASVSVFTATAQPAAFTTQPGVVTGPNPMTVVSGDVTGDGLVDLVVPQASGGVLLVRAQPGSSYAAPQVLPTGPSPYHATIADLDGDGRLDLATADFGGDSVTVLLQTGCSP